MTKVKVTFNSIIRRFTVNETITWSELEQKIRTLFSISDTTPIFLSYTDEDGDIITLSTDLELNDILSSETVSTVNFNLATACVFEGNSQREDNDPIARDAAQSQNHAESVDEHSVQFQNKDNPRPVQNITANQEPTVIQLAQKFQGMLDNFQDVLDQHPQLIDTANNIMDKILDAVPVNLDSWAEWMNGFRTASEEQQQPTDINQEQAVSSSSDASHLGSHHDNGEPVNSLCNTGFIMKAVLVIISLFIFFRVIRFVFGLAFPLFLTALVLRFFRRGGRHTRNSGWWRRGRYGRGRWGGW